MLESNHLKTIVKDALLQDTWIQPVPLTEDMAARKIPVLENAHKLLNFRQECMLDLSEADEVKMKKMRSINVMKMYAICR